jgi:hypothetical protein
LTLDRHDCLNLACSILLAAHKRWHHQELAQGRADCSKTAKVIFRQINMFESPNDAGFWGERMPIVPSRQKLRLRN